MRSLPLFLIALGCASTALAQQAPAEVTDGEIAKYKKEAAAGCREAGLKRGDSQVVVDAFCACVIATLEKTMKRTEWQQAYFYSSVTKDDEGHKAALGPHLASVKQCGAKPAPQAAPQITPQAAPQPAKKP